jgi:Uma2 family endonuclease
MSIQTPVLVPEEIEYPDSDGQPIADNTLQFEWIVTIEGGLEALFRDQENVFVGGDLLWYPVEGNPSIRVAPDALVVFGRPKGYRGSYRQWREEGIAPHVVFEVLSPNNRLLELVRKYRFYERYGVEEYYVYDPETGELTGWLRQGEELREVEEMRGWVSPRLGVRFDLEGKDLRLTGPDGRPFASYVELTRQRDELAQQRDELAQQRDELAQQRDELAQQRDELARQRDLAQEQASRLAARLRELGVEPDRG